MEISIHRSVSGQSVLTWSVQFKLDRLSVEEQKAIANYQLGSFLIARDGRLPITLDKFVKKNSFSFSHTDSNKVIDFEQRAKDGLTELSINNVHSA